MKKILFNAMFAASLAVMICCTAEDPFEAYNNSNSEWNNNGNTSGGNSVTTGELATFDVICCAANYVGFQPKLPMCVDFLHFQHNINLTAQR